MASEVLIRAVREKLRISDPDWAQPIGLIVAI